VRKNSSFGKLKRSSIQIVVLRLEKRHSLLFRSEQKIVIVASHENHETDFNFKKLMEKARREKT